jgi:hypothetical protein
MPKGRQEESPTIKIKCSLLVPESICTVIVALGARVHRNPSVSVVADHCARCDPAHSHLLGIGRDTESCFEQAVPLGHFVT